MIKAFLRSVLPEAALSYVSAYDHYLNGEPELRLVRHLCQPGRNAVDVGANIGTYTFFMRKYAKRVFAYEPVPRLAQSLARRFPDVVVRQAAVSSESGETILRIPIAGDRESHEEASLAQTFDDRPVKEITVHTVTLDGENLDDVGFIKVDVEQHELAVLNGAIDTIRRCRPTVMTETSVLLYPKPLPAMFDFITGDGYNGFFRFDGRFHPLSTFDPAIHADRQTYGTRFMGNNVIFLPKERDSSFLR